MKHIILPSALTLSLSIFTLFFSSCAGEPKAPANQPAEPATTEVPATQEPDTTALADTTTTQPDTTAQIADRDEEPVEPVATTDPTPVTPSGGGDDLVDHTEDEERMSVILDLIAQDLEAQKLAYVSSLGQDCSGIYHKIKDQLQRKMKVLGDKSKYHYPTYEADRNSRQIAYWYHQNGNLHIVRDAKSESKWIRPGSVMFYGRTEEKYSNPTIELLTNPGKFVHDGTNGKIMHIAVVTKVIKDENDNVINYTIMHGRNSKYTASRTSGNHEGAGYDKAHAKFPFGNWNQQWVAVANIETPLK